MCRIGVMTHRLRATEFSTHTVIPASHLSPLLEGREQAAASFLWLCRRWRGLAGFPSVGDRHRGHTGLQTYRQEWVWCGQASILLKNKHQALEASYLEIPSTGM